MSDLPRLIETAIPSGARRHVEFALHITEAVTFSSEDQRVIPPSVFVRLNSLGEQGQEIIAALERLSGFLSHTFVFDDLDAERREQIRDELGMTDPVGHAWYEAHMLRINRITAATNTLAELGQHVGRFLKQTMDVNIDRELGKLIESVRFRWKQVPRELPDLPPHVYNGFKKDFIQAQLAPLVLDVFDASVFIFNGKQVDGTLRNGGISRTMQEIGDTYAAMVAGQPAPDRSDPERA